MVLATSQQEFSDADFRIVDNGDQSKKVALEVSGVTTATTRTLTVPNASGTIALTSDLTSYVPTSRTISAGGIATGGGDLSANRTITVPAATQSDQETATSTTTAVTPGRQQFHPSASKAWCRFNAAGTIAASYNITSITDNGTGDWTVNIGTDFSSANYSAAVDIGWQSGVGVLLAYVSASPTAGAFRVASASNFAGTAGDPTAVDAIFFQAFGDQ